MSADPRAFVEWFRGAAPYINAHRGRTFVVQFAGEAVQAATFRHLARDLALLFTLGVRLVLVHGIRPQIDERLRARGLPIRVAQGLRITDTAALEAVREAAGSVRTQVEALLTASLTNTPRTGTRVRVTSGNYVTARPLGVRNGIDFGHTGEVRRIDRGGIEAQLDAGNVVLVTPIGYSPTGEDFNLSAEEVATALAVELRAAKLVLIGEPAELRDERGLAARQFTVDQARQRLVELRREAGEDESDTIRHLQSAVHACRHGVQRVHLLDRHVDGVVLLELFTRDGVGTMISVDAFEHMRRARIEDVGGVLELIRPLEEEGVLVRRPREKLEQEIERYTVVDRDGAIIACAALHPFVEEGVAELACLAVSPAYRNAGLGDDLLERIQRDALAAGAERVFVLTTRTTHWFLERGFAAAAIEDLPVTRQATYNYQRNSKVLIKALLREPRVTPPPPPGSA